VTTIVVRYHQEGEAWWAETDALPTFSAAGDTFGEVRERAHSALQELIGPPLDIEDDVSDVGAPIGVVVQFTHLPAAYPTVLRTSLGRSGTSITRRGGPAAVGYLPASVAT
jgi:predicted RNase H-like HicB family nuclease